MDSQSAPTPDLRMPPPSVGADNLSSLPTVGSNQGTDPSAGVISDASDTVLVDPHDDSPEPLVPSSANPVPNNTPQGDGVVGAADDDSDSLDEEWIQKAKVIVGQTRLDPYQQSQEISKVKASYLKTHYNKDIKVSEDQSL